MKTALIIPVHKQRLHWMRMLSAIERLSVLPHRVYVMLDRPSRSDHEFIKNACNVESLRNTYKVCNVQEVPEYVGRPNNLPDQTMFLTGHRRNLAIEYAIEDGCECFVFIDGDCVPQPDLIKSHQRANQDGMPNLSVGRRRDSQYNWYDQREVSESMKPHKLFTGDYVNIITDWDLLSTSAIVWSCNISLNLDAVNKLKKFNKLYYGREDVFHSDFLGTWGGEDGFLGIESHLANIRITTLCDSYSGIKHINHERPISKYAGDAFSDYLQAHIDLLMYKIKNQPIPSDF